MRKIGEIQADLKAAKAELRSCLRAAGDDYGCDGTADHADGLRGWIASYEVELAEARRARKQSLTP